MANLSSFYDARRLFREYTGYSEPLSFDEWNSHPSGHKAALLFVQFFDQITLAWEKANAFDFIDGEEGVSIVNQYLNKNVPIIENQPKRFTPRYIYRVAYNCMYCICHDLLSVKDRWENETSGIVVHDGEELNLFDTFADTKGSASDVSEYAGFEKEFWSVIEDEGLSAEKVMRYLMSHDAADLKKMNPRNKRYKLDPLRDVDVKLEEVDSIISVLREKFLSLPQNSACGQYISRFEKCAG